MTEQLDMTKLEGLFKEHNQKVDVAVKSAKEEMEARAKEGLEGIRTETKGALENLVKQGVELAERLAAVEQKAAGRAEEMKDRKDFAAKFVESDGIKAFREGRSNSFRMETKTAITNLYPTSTSQPLVGADRMQDIIKNPDRVLRISSLLPHMRTASNHIFYPKENVFTNNAAPQWSSESPTVVENVSKAESAITFTSGEASVVTIAHFVPASRQVLDDSPMLESYIRGRLMYGLGLEVEDEILNGAGTSGKLNGLLNQAYALSASVSGTANRLDVLRQAITRLQLTEFVGSNAAVVLNPSDWEAIELTKVNAGTDDRYIAGDARSLLSPSIWGMPVVLTNSIAAGTALVGAFDQCGAVFDREDMSIRMSEHEGNNFTKNMVTILAECRLALAVWRTSALVKVTF